VATDDSVAHGGVKTRTLERRKGAAPGYAPWGIFTASVIPCDFCAPRIAESIHS
jgi:hypothetical protein